MSCVRLLTRAPCSLKQIHRFVRFSLPFAMDQIGQRWYELLYNDSVASKASRAMVGLVTQGRRVRWTKEEEAVLRSRPYADLIKVNGLAQLMNENAHVFHPVRTLASIEAHLHKMKSQGKLDGAVSATAANSWSTACSLEATDGDVLAPLPAFDQMAATVSAQAADHTSRRPGLKRHDERSETSEQLDRIAALDLERQLEADRQKMLDERAVAYLHGTKLRVLVTKSEFVLGRSSTQGPVDADLQLEGDAGKVSRRQALIILGPTGRFTLRNLGKRPVLVNGTAVGKGESVHVKHDSVLTVCGLSFVFEINKSAVAAVLAAAKETGGSAAAEEAGGAGATEATEAAKATEAPDAL